jgi:hypothetical protein
VKRAPRKKRVQPPKTPVIAALKADSLLVAMVKDGLGAVIDLHRHHFDEDIRSSFGDSLDIDAAFKKSHEQANRWDYLVGHTQSNQVIAVEPHSAENSEITTVIKKHIAAQLQLRDHLRNGVFVAKWLWVASGKVQFNPMEKATFQLAQNGIQFVGRKVMNKHLA